MSAEILFLANRIPFPPDRSDKIRAHHVLKGLAEIAPVHVATFAETGQDWEQKGELASVAASHCLAHRRKPELIAGAEALLRREPRRAAAYRDAKLAHYVGEILASRPIETIYVFTAEMGQYVPAGFRGRVVADLVDVVSSKIEASSKFASWPNTWFQARESRLLRRLEERLAHRAERTLLVSEQEASLFRSRLEQPKGARIVALRSGIDIDYYDPKQVRPEPSLSEGRGPHLVFTGQMNSPHNVRAARRVVEAMLPAVREHFPFAQFHIVGREPTHQILEFDWRDGVRVWGEVPDLRPFLAAADVVLAPLESVRRVEHKVLGAMAMARPVVLTREAAIELDAEDGVHFAIEESNDGFVARLHHLLGNRDAASAMGAAARNYVIENHGWRAMLAGLPGLVGLGGLCVADLRAA
ncbi:MAG TPA: TIGR03087 family PEP-CTERM/XrtA system glycosyltransferase [Sphingomonadaceae bacterium]|nr:TIGR03087 family PEP-CTERM/XrtA system glycosyltransferase [Sphingomonadaceae bacterium]